MPIYEYQALLPKQGCEMCKKGFEYFQGIDEKPLSFCPKCNEKVKKIISLCYAAIIDSSPEFTSVERKVAAYEKDGMYSHAAELADKYSHKTKDNLLKERALNNYKKAGYDFNSTTDTSE